MGAAPMLSEKTVLIVDDMKTVRMKLRQICSQLGIRHIYEAADGKLALQTLETIAPDLILSDWNMPNMTGIELLAQVRKMPQLADVPVIFVTSEDQKENILKSIMTGVTDYIVKPFPDNLVKQKICSSLKIATPKV